MRKLLAAVLLLSVLVACNGASSVGAPGSGATVDLEDEAQRASYAQGFQIGRQGEELPIEVEAFVAGIRDGLGGESRLDDAALQEGLERFGQYVSDASAAAAEARASEGEANRIEGEEFLAENATRAGVQVTDSGLQYEVIEEGDGPRPQAATDVVRVHYTGTLLDGTEFDSSRDGDPATFPLNRVIAGWTEGLQLMPVGSTYRFWIPGDLAYGPNPRGDVIGPNDTLVFEVELLEIVQR